MLNMVNKITDPLSYATDADQSILEEIARLDGLRVRSKASWRMRVRDVLSAKITLRIYLDLDIHVV